MKTIRNLSIVLLLGVAMGVANANKAPDNPPLNQWFPLQSSDPKAKFEGYYSDNYASYRERFSNGWSFKVCVYSEDNQDAPSENANISYIPDTENPPAYVEVEANQTVEIWNASAINKNKTMKANVKSWVPGDVYTECRFKKKAN